MQTHAGTSDSLRDKVALRAILRKSLYGHFFILFMTLSSVSVHNLIEYTNRLTSEKNQCWQNPHLFLIAYLFTFLTIFRLFRTQGPLLGI